MLEMTLTEKQFKTLEFLKTLNNDEKFLPYKIGEIAGYEVAPAINNQNPKCSAVSRTIAKFHGLGIITVKYGKSHGNTLLRMNRDYEVMSTNNGQYIVRWPDEQIEKVIVEEVIDLPVAQVSTNLDLKCGAILASGVISTFDTLAEILDRHEAKIDELFARSEFYDREISKPMPDFREEILSVMAEEQRIILEKCDATYATDIAEIKQSIAKITECLPKPVDKRVEDIQQILFSTLNLIPEELKSDVSAFAMFRNSYSRAFNSVIPRDPMNNRDDFNQIPTENLDKALALAKDTFKELALTYGKNVKNIRSGKQKAALGDLLHPF